MIKTISMCKVASFKEKIDISDFGKFNLFYGLNGTGKTTLSQFLATQHENNPSFSECSIEWEDGNAVEILVYNQVFIQKNFYETNQQKGIFTLGENNANANKAISEVRSFIEKSENNRKELTTKKISIEQDDKENKDTLKENIWLEKTDQEKTSFKRYMDGLRGSKDKFFDNLLTVGPFAQNVDNISMLMNELSNELKSLDTDDAQKKKLHPILEINLENIEQNPIFTEKIIGIEDSYLADLIKKLNHADWVNKGISDYLEHTDDCPFCKRNMDHDLKESIKSHIDDTYKNKIVALKRLKEAYQNEDFKEVLSQYKVIEVKGLRDLIENLEATLKNNTLQIEKKIENPSFIFSCSQTSKIIEEINKIINIENNNIEIFNKKLDNKQQEIKGIGIKFWQLFRKKFDVEISKYTEQSKKYEIEIQNLKIEIDKLNKQIEGYVQVICEHKENIKNIDKSVSRINSLLKSFGLEGFEMKRIDDNDKEPPLYEIVRDELAKDTFKTLSEGEKTLITFLYFIETCLGTDNIESDIQARNRIIVIDDPISSLSFNLVFDVAMLIKDHFLHEKTLFKQIFVLTHHLYFFHELYKDIKTPEIKYYRITKCHKTAITSINKKDIINNYESYWQTVKDVKNGKSSPVVLPNAMRNILENCFSFIKRKHTIKDIFKALINEDSDPSLKTFNRYINRRSHSDGDTLTDTQDIDPQKFINHFESIFKAAGLLEHYQAMIEDEPLTSSKL